MLPGAPVRTHSAAGAIHRARVAIAILAVAMLTIVPIILIWTMVGERLKGKAFSSELMTMSLVLGLAVIGMTQLNIERSLNWLHWVLLLVQILMTVFLWKRLWSPLMQKLRG